MNDKRFDDRESIEEIDEYIKYLDSMKATVDKMLEKSIDTMKEKDWDKEEEE